VDIAGRGVEYSKGKRGVRSALWLSAAALAVILAFAACGKGKLPAGSGILPGPSSALTQLEKLPCPEGVEVTLWDELKGALKEALAKATSMPPTGNTNRIEDLACSLDDDSEYVLSWLYRNCGDYNQNGAVGIEDITPLAIHFGEDATPENEWIDGDFDGRVHISDITPIAMNFGVNVHHYSIQGSHFFGGFFTEVAQLVFPESAPNDARLVLEHSLGEEPEYLYWRIVPVDNKGNAGDASNTAQVSAAPPPAVRILSINPLGGVTGTEVTFNAVVSGETPFDYAWDFGGGAEPDESTEEAPTVTLGPVDTYDASLAVENADGSAVKHFTLTVSAEPGEPPQIISVSPTEGDSGTEVTFTAEVTGDGPFEYYWDFGGGASPNQSSGVSDQPSATVTLSRGGTLPEPVATYPASLTVVNPFGMSTHDFSLAVSAWWHVEEIPYVPYRTKSSVVSPKFSRDGVLCGASKYTNDDEDGVVAYERLESGVWVVEQAVVGNYAPYYSAMGFAFDSMDNPAISWGDYNDGAVHLAVKRGGVWEHEVVAPGGLFAPWTEVLFNSQDRVVIVFGYITGNEDESGRKIAREMPGGWEIFDRPNGVVALGCDDKVAVACNEPDANRALLYRETDTGWETTLIVETQEGDVAHPGCLAIDSAGYAHAIVGGSHLGLIVAREQSSGSFEIEAIESPLQDKSLILLPGDEELVLFTGSYSEDVPVLAWHGSEEWEYGTSPIAGSKGTLTPLVHPAGYLVLVSVTQIAAYW